jgi:hypothetical protein
VNQHPRILEHPHLVRVDSGAIAAGAMLTWSPPSRQHVELISVYIEFTTDATVLNRRLSIEIAPAGKLDVQLTASGNQPASQVYPYHFLRGCNTMPQVPTALGWYGPLPMGFLWPASHQLRTAIDNMQAGDQITHYTLNYMMWQDPAVIP